MRQLIWVKVSSERREGRQVELTGCLGARMFGGGGRGGGGYFDLCLLSELFLGFKLLNFAMFLAVRLVTLASD